MLPQLRCCPPAILTPVIANITAFHVAHDMPGNMIWLGTLAFFAAAAYRHRERLKGLIDTE
ncbi:MAG: hypothetical protein AAGE52_08910 [Myxococcota bacterium]